VPPSLSIVICSLNGAEGIDRCLCALNAQTIRPSLELIVVDDGSTDPTSNVAHAHGAMVIRHSCTRGISAARNSGINVASAPIVAFLDEDCEPEPQWAERLVDGYERDVFAIGGPLLVYSDSRILLKYLDRNNPLNPQEADLAKSEVIAYRLLLYIKRQWMPHKYGGRREVSSVASANMSVRRNALLNVGGFDERIRFGSEDEDLCRRLARAYPKQRLIFDPTARVVHHFKPSLYDTMRRSRAYGRGSALMYRKWPTAPPTFFPFPVITLALLILSLPFPVLIAATILMPHIFYPRGLRAAIADRDILCLLDPYLQLAQECCDDVGFIEGLWHFRHFPSELPGSPTEGARARSNPRMTE
jgi:glycosyltransferase involved in cell wall biosynthesis